MDWAILYAGVTAAATTAGALIVLWFRWVDAPSALWIWEEYDPFLSEVLEEREIEWDPYGVEGLPSFHGKLTNVGTGVARHLRVDPYMEFTVWPEETLGDRPRFDYRGFPIATERYRPVSFVPLFGPGSTRRISATLTGKPESTRVILTWLEPRRVWRGWRSRKKVFSLEEMSGGKPRGFTERMKDRFRS